MGCKSDNEQIVAIKPLVLQEIKELAVRHEITSIILFGSRARGDHHKTSDIDMAITGGNRNEFSIDVEEETSTLLRFDCVDLDGYVQWDLRKSIEAEGVLIYEKT